MIIDLQKVTQKVENTSLEIPVNRQRLGAYDKTILSKYIEIKEPVQELIK